MVHHPLVQDDEGRIAGAITRDIRDGSMELFAAKAVILACGATAIYDPTTNALICTGDGSRWRTGSARR